MQKERLRHFAREVLALYAGVCLVPRGGSFTAALLVLLLWTMKAPRQIGRGDSLQIAQKLMQNVGISHFHVRGCIDRDIYSSLFSFREPDSYPGLEDRPLTQDDYLSLCVADNMTPSIHSFRVTDSSLKTLDRRGMPASSLMTVIIHILASKVQIYLQICTLSWSISKQLGAEEFPLLSDPSIYCHPCSERSGC